MDDLDRLFRNLVNVLAEAEPSHLPSSFEIAELYQRILPYRRYKLALQFDSVEDYEMAILRLLAGERGYAIVQPADVQAVLRAQTESVNPYPGAFREYAAATVLLDRASVNRFLDDATGYAPPSMRAPTETQEQEPTAEDSVEEEEEPSLEAGPVPQRERPQFDPAPPAVQEPVAPAAGPSLVFEAVEAARRCPHCRGELPHDRHAVYCPHCGHQLDTRTCGRCGEPVEKGWRFCLACGFAIGV